MRHMARAAVLCALAAAWAGCATPRSAFYTLGPAAKPAAATADYSVSVGPVSVPEIVDRPQIVVQAGPNRVFIDEFNRWASPLRGDIARVVAGNLASLLGTPGVTAYPRPPPADVRYLVRLDVTAFESAPGEAAVLEAVWTVRGAKGDAVRSGRSVEREPVRGEGYEALAAAHSRALAAMSGEIADAIRAMEGGGR